jgi:phosphoribosylanthranilate isomerase
MKIKICGITNLDDALLAAEYGADYLGFIFYPPSPRFINEHIARPISDYLRDHFGEQRPHLVGVFVNETAAGIDTKMSQAALDLAQLSGSESVEVLKAIRFPAYKAIQPQALLHAQEDIAYYTPYGPENEAHPNILIDAYHPNLHGGTGELADTALVQQIQALAPRMMLAGGLTPENVGGQIRAIRPFGVDVASGVEASKGQKDPQKVIQFIQEARAAAQESNL